MVDLFKAQLEDDPVAQDALKELYYKFIDKHGAINLHLVDQAAWFIDWCCRYVGPQIGATNVNRHTGTRASRTWSAGAAGYKKFRGKPPQVFYGD